MKPFMDKNFLLSNETAQKLYFDYAATTPVLDYHCHINPQEIYRGPPVRKHHSGMARRRPLQMALYAFLRCG